jgi:hypothetical protein
MTITCNKIVTFVELGFHSPIEKGSALSLKPQKLNLVAATICFCQLFLIYQFTITNQMSCKIIPATPCNLKLLMWADHHRSNHFHVLKYISDSWVYIQLTGHKSDSMSDYGYEYVSTYPLNFPGVFILKFCSIISMSLNLVCWFFQDYWSSVLHQPS